MLRFRDGGVTTVAPSRAVLVLSFLISCIMEDIIIKEIHFKKSGGFVIFLVAINTHTNVSGQ